MGMLVDIGVMPWDFDDFICRLPQGGFMVLAGSARSWAESRVLTAQRRERRQNPRPQLEAIARGGGIGAFVKGMLLEGAEDYEAIAAAAREKFPGAHTTASCVSWYRSRLRAEGKIA
jgi:hypothetical protein